MSEYIVDGAEPNSTVLKSTKEGQMTNEEWLESLAHNDIPALREWFKADHVESPESGALVQCAQIDWEGRERAADGDTEPENADSRERLEAEIESYSAFSMMDTITLDMVIGWLDRQAAITEREYGERMVSEAMCSRICVVVSEQREQIAELTAERDELRARVDYLESRHCAWADPDSRGDGCMWRKDEVFDALKAERDNLAKDRALANNERERYRCLLGKALDYADAIHALADEGLA